MICARQRDWKFKNPDIRIIQELLGHNSSKTAEIYTPVSTKSIQQISYFCKFILIHLGNQTKAKRSFVDTPILLVAL